VSERFRPAFHFTPRRHWINDPNGLVYVNGLYHLFYQHNPHGEGWGHMSWGHAVSRDLLQWEEWPLALHERPDHMCFSGSAVNDAHNTSGLGRAGQAPLVAVYTGVRVSDGRQAQYLAHSLDGGLTWTQNQQPVLDIGSTGFRDPRVFWCQQTQRWIMLVALSSEHRLSFYGSANLHDWTHLSDFGPHGETGGVWECPELLLLPIEGESGEGEPGKGVWMLKVDLNPGGPWGGSGCQYWTGDFDGTHFLPHGKARWLDHGSDFYAAQAWTGAPGGPIWLAWMSNWQYAAALPTSPWRGAMTLPRRVSLRRARADGAHRWQLVQQPVASLETLRTRHWALGEVQLLPGGVLPELPGLECFEFMADFVLTDPCARLGLRLGTDGEGGVQLNYDAQTQQLSLQREYGAATAANPALEGFAGCCSVALPLEDHHLRLHLIVDRCSVEVFAQGGSTTLTSLMFPERTLPGLEWSVLGAPVLLCRLDLWALETGVLPAAGALTDAQHGG
jgi:fructan beta-fructosidase